METRTERIRKHPAAARGTATAHAHGGGASFRCFFAFPPRSAPRPAPGSAARIANHCRVFPSLVFSAFRAPRVHRSTCAHTSRFSPQAMPILFGLFIRLRLPCTPCIMRLYTGYILCVDGRGTRVKAHAMIDRMPSPDKTARWLAAAPHAPCRHGHALCSLPLGRSRAETWRPRRRRSHIALHPM
jgi:hypothetical protein